MQLAVAQKHHFFGISRVYMQLAVAQRYVVT